MVDGGRGRVRRLDEAGRRGSRRSGPGDRRRPADEAFHALAAHARARESVYFNAHDPTRGLTAGRLRRACGTADAARPWRRSGCPTAACSSAWIAGPRGRARAALTVGAITVGWDPPGLRLHGDFAPHEGGDFPARAAAACCSRPAPRRCACPWRFRRRRPRWTSRRRCPPDARDGAVRAGHAPRGAVRRLERGRSGVDGHAWPFAGTGSRDHSWGLRDWDAADHWRLFTLRLPALAVHALVVSARGPPGAGRVRLAGRRGAGHPPRRIRGRARGRPAARGGARGGHRPRDACACGEPWCGRSPSPCSSRGSPGATSRDRRTACCSTRTSPATRPTGRPATAWPSSPNVRDARCLPGRTSWRWRRRCWRSPWSTPAGRWDSARALAGGGRARRLRLRPGADRHRRLPRARLRDRVALRARRSAGGGRRRVGLRDPLRVDAGGPARNGAPRRGGRPRPLWSRSRWTC